jgi:hypothetical protein
LGELEENSILSSTRIEPPLHGESPTTITKDFGLDPEKFDMEAFLKFSEENKSDEILTYFFAPITFHRDTWLKVGGYDTLFRRSREDSDFLVRSLKAGTIIKQTFKANVYHFTCVTSRGKRWYDSQDREAQERVKLQNIADQIEMGRFIRKWGNFAHGEYDLVKFDIDFVYNSDITTQEEFHIILGIEPFVSRVWLKSQEYVDKFIAVHENDHKLANQLLNFSENDWNKSKKFYNLVDFENIFRVGTPQDYNAKLEITTASPLTNIPSLLGIHQSLYSAEPGTYEFEPFRIDIKNKVDVTEDKVVVDNPEFDKTLIIKIK